MNIIVKNIPFFILCCLCFKLYSSDGQIVSYYDAAYDIFHAHVIENLSGLEIHTLCQVSKSYNELCNDSINRWSDTKKEQKLLDAIHNNEGILVYQWLYNKGFRISDTQKLYQPFCYALMDYSQKKKQKAHCSGIIDDPRNQLSKFFLCNLLEKNPKGLLLEPSRHLFLLLVALKDPVLVGIALKKSGDVIFTTYTVGVLLSFLNRSPLGNDEETIVIIKQLEKYYLTHSNAEETIVIQKQLERYYFFIYVRNMLFNRYVSTVSILIVLSLMCKGFFNDYIEKTLINACSFTGILDRTVLAALQQLTMMA